MLKHLPDGWTCLSLGLAAMLLMPIAAVGWLALTPGAPVWGHLVAHTLPGLVTNTLVLMGLVALGTGLIGTGAAWLVVMTDFPGRRVLEWALLAPLAMPAYIGAYALVDALEYAGPVQGALRAAFGWTSARDYWFPQVRSLGACALVLTLVLYPYVYLLTRAAFREQSVCVLEVGRALGHGPWGVFWRVGLPLARPAVAAGMAIVAMEVMADFGAVDYFNVQTLTRGIFSIWLDTHNPGGAAQIALVMLGFVLVLLLVEAQSRRRRRFHHTSRRQRPVTRVRLGRLAGLGAAAALALPVLLGFVAPVGIVAAHAVDHLGQLAAPGFWRAVATTAGLATTAALISASVGVALVYGARASGAATPRLLAQATALGYAAPGAVLAVGVLIPLAALDHRVADLVVSFGAADPGLILTGSAAAVVFAYVVRFSAIAQGAVEGAFGRIGPSIDLAARTLGESATGALTRVHLPLIRGSILTAALLIFVDSVKELPATLILRPFDFETLATRVYGAASLEQLGAAAPAALAIIAVGLAPVTLLARTLHRP